VALASPSEPHVAHYRGLSSGGCDPCVGENTEHLCSSFTPVLALSAALVIMEALTE
jgi:hypothetical protein